jgi:transcription elongation GreA/GreB family factor
MDKLTLKKELLDKCKQLQTKVIDNLKNEMTEAQESANEYGAPRDRYDAFRMQMLRKKDMFAQMLVKALTEYKALEQINTTKISEKVGFGSAVITEDQKIFISSSLGKFEHNGETWIAVSVMVPLAQALSGKKVGEEINFRGKISKIVDLF